MVLEEGRKLFEEVFLAQVLPNNLTLFTVTVASLLHLYGIVKVIITKYHQLEKW